MQQINSVSSQISPQNIEDYIRKNVNFRGESHFRAIHQIRTAIQRKYNMDVTASKEDSSVCCCKDAFHLQLKDEIADQNKSEKLLLKIDEHCCSWLCEGCPCVESDFDIKVVRIPVSAPPSPGKMDEFEDAPRSKGAGCCSALSTWCASFFAESSTESSPPANEEAQNRVPDNVQNPLKGNLEVNKAASSSEDRSSPLQAADGEMVEPDGSSPPVKVEDVMD